LFGQACAVTLSVQDVDAISQAKGVKMVAPLGLVFGVPEADGIKSPHSFVIATSTNAAVVLNQKVDYGDFWQPEHEEAHVAVIGRGVAKQLFDEPVPLGRKFYFRGQQFVVQGMFAPFAKVPFSPTANFDNAIFIPYKMAASITGNSSGLYAVLAKTGDPKNVDSGVKAVEEKLKAAHGGQQDFAVLGSDSSVALGGDAVHLLSMWIIAVAVIALFIGGVGIMNIMLLNVTERMYEIGVRKAIGATSRQILGQFVFEAAVISFIGGAIGIILSLAVIGLLYTYTDLKPIISWQAIAIATGVSIAVGIIFGAAPAAKAARKDPIEALRHE
jgi:putative ABC transport system permease protein